MTYKTIPEKARSLAKFIEENNYIEWPEDWEISLILNVLAGEIESESKAADELQDECNNWHYQYQRMCEHTKRLGAERDEAIEMLKELLKYGYISDGHRRAAYDLVVRLGGYQGKTEGQTDDR